MCYYNVLVMGARGCLGKTIKPVYNLIYKDVNLFSTMVGYNYVYGGMLPRQKKIIGEIRCILDCNVT